METNPRFVSYQDGQREQWVIVKRNIFPWIEKSPFERSGHSVLGAVEMDNDGLVKCHVCGEWHKDISSHVAMSAINGSSRHSSMREYRIRHGVLSTALASPPVTEKRRQNGFKAAKRDAFQEAEKQQSSPQGRN